MNLQIFICLPCPQTALLFLPAQFLQETELGEEVAVKREGAASFPTIKQLMVVALGGR